MKEAKKVNMLAGLKIGENPKLNGCFHRFIISYNNPKLLIFNSFVSIITFLSVFSNMHIAAFQTSHH